MGRIGYLRVLGSPSLWKCHEAMNIFCSSLSLPPPSIYGHLVLSLKRLFWAKITLVVVKVGQSLRQIHFGIWDKCILKFKTNTFWNLRQIHCEMLDFAGSGASQVRTYCGSQPRIWGASKESYTFLSSTNPLKEYMRLSSAGPGEKLFVVFFLSPLFARPHFSSLTGTHF